MFAELVLDCYVTGSHDQACTLYPLPPLRTTGHLFSTHICLKTVICDSLTAYDTLSRILQALLNTKLLSLSCDNAAYQV